ncbi:hypothetical protein HMPREF0629_00487 [Peptoniphilus sp. oral taxon 386 str. F0131]|nr:hypothetical protein HMPREF0629_00487 [Peptoniphilus sp. oral taxon 386 str. F0131]
MAKHDPKGNEFEYYAKEENVPANYKKSIEGLKVTNTYVSPIVPPTILKGDVTANKIWRDYKAIHPTIWFKLYRNIVGGNLEEVPNAEIKELKEGTTKVTWTKQNLEDKKGNKYIFSVKEVDSNGRDYVPYGYEKSEVGLTVINSKKEKDSSNVIVTPAPKLNKKDHFPYVMGYPDGSFKPEGNITRAEMTAIFSRLLTEKMHVGDNYPLSFSDVARSSWYAEYIGQLTSVGVIAGYPDGTFRPENSVTRAEFATVASRFITSKKSTGGFADILNNHWAKESIENVRAEGWISGYSDGSFKPDQYITRAEVVSIVNKMLDRYADKNYVDSHAMELTNYTDLSKNHWAYYPIMEASNGHDYERLSNNQEVWKTSWKPRKY